MRIAHISDIHWRGIQRHDEYNRVFEKLFAKLREIEPDIIVNTGDTFHTKTQGITPEIIDRLSWMFRSLADIAPTYTLLGNHDGNLTNLHRQDVITPIHMAINHPHAHLLRRSEVVAINDTRRNWKDARGDVNFYLCAFSPFDKKGWPTVKPIKASDNKQEHIVNIALYHGSVAGSEMDNNWRLPAELSEANVAEFTEFDFALLGDIHKQQWVSKRLDKNDVSKPWMAYPGSLIQQNFGEDEVKGFLVWDIKDKNDWNVKFEQLENLYPFITIDWQGSVSSTIKAVEAKRQQKAFLPGTRFRVSSSQNIPSIEARKLIHELKEVRGAAEVAFKYDLVSKMEHFTANNLKISKKGLRQDPDAVVKLYLDYIAAHASNYKFNREQLDEAETLIRNYMAKLMLREADNMATNVNWSLKSFEFENLFRYGEDNKIDFETLDGIVGIFGPNKTGKALDIKTPIPTLNGWKTIAELTTHDYVFDRYGLPCRVVAKSPIFTDHQCYKIVFSDNSTVIADAEHQWIVNDHKAINYRSKAEKYEKTLTTEEIYNNRTYKSGQRQINRWSVANCKPVAYPERYTLVHPYVLGCWLGDGHSNSSSITCFDKEIIENIITAGEDVTPRKKDGVYNIKGLRPRLKILNLLGNKHIPEYYLTSSIEDRVHLLQGLMDTDGHCDKRGLVEFVQCNEILARQVLELVCSLGFKATVREENCKLYGRYICKRYRVAFTPRKNDLPVFSLKRKTERIKPTKSITVARSKRRYIVDVQPVKPRPVQCIVVDSQDHSFLFGKNYIATHNSSIVGALMYTLFNTTDRGPMKNAFIINRRKNYGKGRVRLSIGGDDYVIERQSARVIPKRKTKRSNNDKTTTTLNLFKVAWDDAHQHEILKEDNSISRDETDKAIRRKIGTANDFLLTALSSQGGVDKFIKEGPTERKNILSRFLELDIFKQLEELVKRDYSAMDVRSSMLSPESLATQIKKTRKNISELENVISQLDERIQKQQAQKDEVKLWLMHHEKSAAEVDMAQMDDLEEAIKANEEELKTKQEKLENVRDTIAKYRNQLKSNKSSKARIDVEELRQQLDDLEAVRATLHELKHELTTQEGKLTAQKKNVRKLDLVPCGDEYPQCYYIKDAHHDKQRIEKQEKLVETLSSQVEAHQGKLEEYVANRIQENLKKWEQLDREEFDLTTKLESSRKHRDYIKGEIRGLKKSIKSSTSELSSLQKRVNILEGKEYQKKQEQLDRIRQKIGELDKTRHENLVSLGGKRERLSGLLLEQEETRSLIEKLKIYDSIQDAFSKTGIPAMVLSSQLPAINAELNKILESVVDFKITLETDVSSNVMDVYIEDVHSRRIIELASGMEKTIASMALRVALINLSSLPKPDILIIDEGFGALDDENIQSCMEMLTFLRSYFKTILIISHVPQIKEVADRIIEIKHDGVESNVQMI